jgi:hypothetical protein
VSLAFDGIRHAIDAVVGFFPGVVGDAQGLISPINDMLGILQLKAPQIGIVVGIACLVVALVRHVDGKPVPVSADGGTAT